MINICMNFSGHHNLGRVHLCLFTSYLQSTFRKAPHEGVQGFTVIFPLQMNMATLIGWDHAALLPGELLL